MKARSTKIVFPEILLSGIINSETPADKPLLSYHEVSTLANNIISELPVALDVSQTKTPSIVGVDFFCGAGGMTRGFLDAGIDIICGVDTDTTVEQTYTKNNVRSNGKHCAFISTPIQELSKADLSKAIGDRDGKALVFIGCAPCQPFTNLNTDKEKQGKAKNLLGAFAWQIRRFKPEYVVVENVPGIQADKFGGVFQKFVRRLVRFGYSMPNYKILDAKKYGVPQTRKRMVLIASRLDKISLPKETHGPGLLPYLTVRHAIKRFPIIRAGTEHRTVTNHQSASLTSINQKRLKVGRKRWDSKLQLECYSKSDGYTDVYCRMSWNKPSPTLTTRFNSISNGRFGHPSQLRAISTREGAALQTFPDTYIFHAAFTRNAKHIGNAVPVKLATVLADAIVQHYNTYLESAKHTEHHL